MGRSTLYDLIRSHRLRTVKIGRRANGEGTCTSGRDGRYEGAAYVLITDGTRRRIRVYGRTREEASGRLTELMAQHRRGLPAVINAPTVASYLAYWLPNIAKPRVRPLTYRTYEMFVREHMCRGSARSGSIGSQPETCGRS